MQKIGIDFQLISAFNIRYWCQNSILIWIFNIHQSTQKFYWLDFSFQTISIINQFSILRQTAMIFNINPTPGFNNLFVHLLVSSFDWLIDKQAMMSNARFLTSFWCLAWGCRIWIGSNTGINHRWGAVTPRSRSIRVLPLAMSSGHNCRFVPAAPQWIISQTRNQNCLFVELWRPTDQPTAESQSHLDRSPFKCETNGRLFQKLMMLS